MLGLGLKLLGIGKFIKDFIIHNWKWVLPILIVIGSYFYVKHLIADAYDDGVAAEKLRWEERAKVENAANRQTEQTLQNIVNNFGTKIIEQTAVRTAKEQTHTDRINTIIKEKPVYTECKVDQEVIDMRNEIRSLGPEK